MPTPEPDEPTPEPGERRWILLAGLLPAAAVAIGLAVVGAPGYEYGVLLPVTAVGVGVVSYLRRRATRVPTDERDRYLELRARSVGFVAVTLALIGAGGWTYVRHGVAASEPYLDLLVALYVSYVGAMTWLRRRS
jgi:hypothetical protein